MSKESEALVHIATVAVTVELVSRAALYFHAPVGSGEEEVREEELQRCLIDLVSSDEASVANVLMALASLAAEIGPDAIRAWAESEVDVVSGDLG